MTEIMLTTLNLFIKKSLQSTAKVSRQEMADELGVKKTTINGRLNVLRAQGFLMRHPDFPEEYFTSFLALRVAGVKCPVEI